ncbi:MAG TPA: ABC transporter substrate-binding protein [Thermoanaerobaculia bacterium]|nr:ABC transporter substrate-binding protein [Thermoanaerobaculia bacterium]
MNSPRPPGGVLVLVALLGVSCGRAPTGVAAHGKPLQKLRVAVRADITGVFPEPPTQNEAFTIDVFSNVLEGPFRLGANLSVKPALVSTWVNPDDRTWDFRLREGIRFSDGTPLTSADVVASLRAAVEKPFPTAAFLSAIAKVEAVGPFEFRVMTREPSAVLPSYLTAGFVISARALAQSPVLPVGTGPYVYSGRIPGREVLLTRNQFHDPPAPFDEVLLRVLPDPVERVAALVAGDVDIADSIPLEAVDRLSRQDGLVVLARPGIRVLYLAPRVDRPPFSDLRVREALDLAFDRDELNARVYGGRGTPASQPVPVAIAGYDASLSVVRADRKRAQTLVQAASGGAGIDVVLDAPNDRYLNDVALAHEAKRQMELAGFRVTVRTRPKAEYFPFLEPGKAQLHLFGWACDTLEAGDVLAGAFRSRSSPGAPNQNYQGLADPELDRAIDAASGAMEAGERLAHFRSAMKRLRAIRAAAPLVVMPETIAFSKRISWLPPPTFVLRLHEVGLAPEP